MQYFLGIIQALWSQTKDEIEQNVAESFQIQSSYDTIDVKDIENYNYMLHYVLNSAFYCHDCHHEEPLFSSNYLESPLRKRLFHDSYIAATFSCGDFHPLNAKNNDPLNAKNNTLDIFYDLSKKCFDPTLDQTPIDYFEFIEALSPSIVKTNPPRQPDVPEENNNNNVAMPPLGNNNNNYYSNLGNLFSEPIITYDQGGPMKTNNDNVSTQPPTQLPHGMIPKGGKKKRTHKRRNKKRKNIKKKKPSDKPKTRKRKKKQST